MRHHQIINYGSQQALGGCVSCIINAIGDCVSTPVGPYRCFLVHAFYLTHSVDLSLLRRAPAVSYNYKPY